MNKEEIINWVRDYLNSFGGNTKAIIGISGGKDSTVAAKVCIEAVGKDRVIGVRMPQGVQHDIDVSRKVCDYLGIKTYEINIGPTCDALKEEIEKQTGYLTSNYPVYYSNTPARVRMMTLYGIAALEGDSRVVNTCNRSEDYVGYATKFGDGAGDFSPLMNLTVREVKELGRSLGIPTEFIEKKPEDGLSGKTDEDNLGFTYETLDSYLLSGIQPDFKTLNNIETRHRNNLHKLEPMPRFEPDWLNNKTQEDWAYTAKLNELLKDAVKMGPNQELTILQLDTDGFHTKEELVDYCNKLKELLEEKLEPGSFVIVPTSRGRGKLVASTLRKSEISLE